MALAYQKKSLGKSSQNTSSMEKQLTDSVISFVKTSLDSLFKSVLGQSQGYSYFCQFHLHLHQLLCLKDSVLMAALNRLIYCFTKKVSQANYRKLTAARSPVIRASVKNATTGTQLRTALQSGFAFLLDRLHPHPRPFTQLCFFPQ